MHTHTSKKSRKEAKSAEKKYTHKKVQLNNLAFKNIPLPDKNFHKG